MIETAENIKSIYRSSRAEWLSGFPGAILGTQAYGGKTDAVATGNREMTVLYFTLYLFLKRSTLPNESTILCSPV